MSALPWSLPGAESKAVVFNSKLPGTLSFWMLVNISEGVSALMEYRRQGGGMRWQQSRVHSWYSTGTVTVHWRGGGGGGWGLGGGGGSPGPHLVGAPVIKPDLNSHLEKDRPWPKSPSQSLTPTPSTIRLRQVWKVSLLNSKLKTLHVEWELLAIVGSLHG